MALLRLLRGFRIAKPLGRWAFGQPIAQYSRARLEEAASRHLLAAGPRLQNSFKREVFEPFVDQLWSLVDVRDDHSECLSNSDALGPACSEVVAGEVMHCADDA